MSFDTSLQFGQTGESAIARWLRSRGYMVMPVYEKILDTGKGPQLFLPDNDMLIAPDMFVFRANNTIWIEAKHKNAFSWYRKTERWVTGIDLRHYEHYCRVDDETPWPVLLLFLHRGGQAKDSPPSPSGLYGRELSKLRRCESHRSDKWGPSGMVYWTIDNLCRLARLEDIEMPTLMRKVA